MTGPTTACSREQACTAFSKFWDLYFPHINAYSKPKLPQTSLSRLSAPAADTILYLAYGSNLSAETFRGGRGIKPLSAVSVQVPSLSLTFDLAGIPYLEPCFANTRYRDPPPPTTTSTCTAPTTDEYHKDRWHKGLIGTVYEVTPEDYRTIIATEGGGAGYQDIVVDCYVLPEGAKSVNPVPSGAPFRAHTLLCPEGVDNGGRISRPDPSYAQASARYLKLITDGAEEHSLPDEYLAYLYDLRPYTISTYRQRIGSVLFLGFWLPIIMALLSFSKMLADEHGRFPGWLVKVTEFVFEMVWRSYDVGFKTVFGDGERTMETGDDEENRSWTYSEKTGRTWCESKIRLEGS